VNASSFPCEGPEALRLTMIPAACPVADVIVDGATGSLSRCWGQSMPVA
jgi:hypothetical protein